MSSDRRTTASAASKAILLGEHAVVYGRPAIAVPVSDVRATAEVVSLPPGSGVLLVARDLGETFRLDEAPASDAAQALQTTVRNTWHCLGLPADKQALRITVSSDIPIARGMGSGTAVATAVVRVLAQHAGQDLAAGVVSELVYQTEIILHGTPSGIDNTVVAYERPIYFARGQEAETLAPGQPFSLLIADTGQPSRTHDTVGKVRGRWLAERERYEALFDRIGAVVKAGREALVAGDTGALGALMDRNQELLVALQVSSAGLDHLIAVARSAGALGAKLSGGGGGGCLIALVTESTRATVRAALLAAGAERVLSTTVC